MKKFNIKVGDRKFIVSADNEAKAVKKLKDAQAKKMSDAHTRIKVGCAEITVNNEAKAYSVGSVAWFNGRDERTFRDYAKQCIDVANKIKELESKGYKEDVMKAYDSAVKDGRFIFNVHYKNGETKNIDVQALNYQEAVRKLMADPNVDSIDDIHDSAEELRDAVALKRGDWFAFRRDRKNLYKLIDDKAQERNGFAKSLLAEHYVIDYDYKDLYASDLMMKKEGTTTLRPDRLDEIIVFNSADEALKWFRIQLKVLNGLHKR